jgi:ABC-type Fe3+/spermidine/putrescine transport system ATPase subunit
MSDRIAVMSDGKIMQFGTPREIYLTPVTGRVARIVGSVNLLHGALERRDGQLAAIRTSGGSILHCQVFGEHDIGDSLDVMFRPELVRVARRGEAIQGGPPSDPDDPDNLLPGSCIPSSLPAITSPATARPMTEWWRPSCRRTA